MKKAFTLIEILIVVIIIGIIMASIGKMFSYKQVDRANFDTCYVGIYGNIVKFFQEALLQRSVYTGNYKKPSIYVLKFDQDNQKIDFIYSGTNVINSIILAGSGVDSKYKCYNKTYHTYLSGDIKSVYIKPGLQVDKTESSPFYIYDNSNHILPTYDTGVVYFYYCDQPSNIGCLQKYKIEIDPRSYLFKSSFCKETFGNGLCKEWAE